MVRRIVSDSDLESDAGVPEEGKTAVLRARCSPCASSPAPEAKRPTSTRKLVRGKVVKTAQPRPWGTYDYDSDIYTEESSLGSFIVYSDEEGGQDKAELSPDRDGQQPQTSDSSPSPLPTLDKLRIESDSETEDSSDAVNPQPCPRKQTAQIDKAVFTPSHIHCPVPSHKNSSNQSEDTKSARKQRKSFTQQREQLALDLVQAIDKQVMGGKLSAATSSTGGIHLIWSSKLRTAAGKAHWNRVQRPMGDEKNQHHLKIELSPKLITSEDKLRNTLAHELCHCALWVIDQDPKSHHGKQFKAWSARITEAFPDIQITTKHTYEIEYKFIYTCSNESCGLDFGRQKKIDLNQLVCGSCKSRLFERNPSRKDGGAKQNRPNPFAMFVKEHFAGVKKENPGSTHRDVMATLSKMYREQKEMSTGGLIVECMRDESKDDIEVLGSISTLDLK